MPDEPPRQPSPRQPLGILLISGGHERGHYAFILAAAAAAIGRPVTIFATNEGCRMLASQLPDDARDGQVRAAGVAGLGELRDAAAELGVRLMACDAGLRMVDLPSSRLLPDVEIAGVPSFLAAVGEGQIITL